MAVSQSHFWRGTAQTHLWELEPSSAAPSVVMPVSQSHYTVFSCLCEEYNCPALMNDPSGRSPSWLATQHVPNWLTTLIRRLFSYVHANTKMQLWPLLNFYTFGYHVLGINLQSQFPEHDIQMYTIVAIIAFLCLHDVAKKTTHECCKPVRHMLSMSCESWWWSPWRVVHECWALHNQTTCWYIE